MQKALLYLFAAVIGASPALSASVAGSSGPLNAGGLLDSILSALTPSTAEPMLTPLAMATAVSASDLFRRQNSTGNVDPIASSSASELGRY